MLPWKWIGLTLQEVHSRNLVWNFSLGMIQDRGHVWFLITFRIHFMHVFFLNIRKTTWPYQGLGLQQVYSYYCLGSSRGWWWQCHYELPHWKKGNKSSHMGPCYVCAWINYNHNCWSLPDRSSTMPSHRTQTGKLEYFWKQIHVNLLKVACALECPCCTCHPIGQRPCRGWWTMIPPPGMISIFFFSLFSSF